MAKTLNWCEHFLNFYSTLFEENGLDQKEGISVLLKFVFGCRHMQWDNG